MPNRFFKKVVSQILPSIFVWVLITSLTSITPLQLSVNTIYAQDYEDQPITDESDESSQTYESSESTTDNQQNSIIEWIMSFFSSSQSNAVVAPPSTNPSAKPTPGQTYPVSTQLEEQLKIQKVEFDPPLPGVSSTITFGGRTWNTWQTNQEQDFITAIDTGSVELTTEQQNELNQNCLDHEISLDVCSNIDIILIAAVTGTIVTGVGIAFAGPAVAAIISEQGVGGALTWSFNGIVGAVTAGSMNLSSRFAAAPAWFASRAGLVSGFLELPACEYVSQMSCQYYLGLPKIFLPNRGIPLKSFVTQEFETESYRLNYFYKFTKPYEIKTIANQFNYKGMPLIGGYGNVYRNGSTALKVYKEFGLGQLARQQDELRALKLAQGIPGVPTFYGTHTVGQIENVTIRNNLISNGVHADDVIAMEMEFIEGLGIEKFREQGRRITQQAADQAINSYDEIVKRTGNGLGDHFGNWTSQYSKPAQNFHAANTIIEKEGTKISFIDFGGTSMSPAEIAREREVMINVLQSMVKR